MLFHPSWLKRALSGIQVLFSCFVAITAWAAEPATLGVSDILQGIEENQKAWLSQKNWMVHYTHMRERIAPPPGAMVEFPDAELINARQKTTLYSYFKQGAIGNPEHKLERWMLWRDNHYTEQMGQNAYKQNEPTLQIISYYWYPFALWRDLFSDAIPVPAQAFNDPELALLLPHCLKSNQAEYSIRENLEVIDESLCHVLERPGKDIIWIDTNRGFNVCRRTILQPSGNVLAEFKASGWTEPVPGIWLPYRQISVAFNQDDDPKEYQGKVRFVMTNSLREVRFNDLPDNFFEVPIPEGVLLLDHRTK